MTEPAIFISYRIADTQVEARLLFTDLANYFGKDIAFLDKKRLESGMDWPDALAANVQKAKILLVLIKDESKWLGVNRLGGRRMDDPKDWVRREIETALSDGKIVIPVLVDGAMLPPMEVLPDTLHDFLRKQGRKVATEKWDSDIAALFADLEKTVPRKESGAATDPVLPLAEYPLPADVPDPLDHHPAPFLGLPFFSRTAARLFFWAHTRNPRIFQSCRKPRHTAYQFVWAQWGGEILLLGGGGVASTRNSAAAALRTQTKNGRSRKATRQTSPSAQNRW